MNPKRLRSLIFAVLMSCSTAMLVSAAILAFHGVPREMFLSNWFKSVLLAWPLVFISILAIAPVINRMLDKIFKN